jgi:hypothetical protein
MMDATIGAMSWAPLVNGSTMPTMSRYGCPSTWEDVCNALEERGEEQTDRNTINCQRHLTVIKIQQMDW